MVFQSVKIGDECRGGSSGGDLCVIIVEAVGGLCPACAEGKALVRLNFVDLAVLDPVDDSRGADSHGDVSFVDDSVRVINRADHVAGGKEVFLGILSRIVDHKESYRCADAYRQKQGDTQSGQ